jgi:hypothetical protein
MPDNLAETVQNAVVTGFRGDFAMLELYACFYYVERVPFYALSLNVFSSRYVCGSHITKISEIPATAPAANWYRNGSGFALF